MKLFNCADGITIIPISVTTIGSTDYTDCVVTTVSGHLQSEIDSIGSPGWQVLGSATGTNLTLNDSVVLDNIPARDILRIIISSESVLGDPFGYVGLNFNDDFEVNNYIAAVSPTPAGGITVSTAGTSADNFHSEMIVMNIVNLQKTVTGNTTSCRADGSSTDTTSQNRLAWTNTDSRISKMIIRFYDTNTLISASANKISIKVLGMNF